MATIYFITQFCAASNREQSLLNSVFSVKTFLNVKALRKASFVSINKELRCSDLVLKQTFQLLDQPLLCAIMLAGTAMDSELEESH